jgi:excisionase family DNA binding protein
MQENIKEVMTTNEVMAYLRITRKTLLKLIKEGKIKAVKVGKDYRYLKTELERFLRGGEEGSVF